MRLDPYARGGIDFGPLARALEEMTQHVHEARRGLEPVIWEELDTLRAEDNRRTRREK